MPVKIAMAVALIGFVALLLVDHGPWNKSSAESTTMIEVGRTAGVAAAAGAVITDTTLRPDKSESPAIKQ